MAKFTDAIQPINVVSSQVSHPVDNSFANLVNTFSSAIPKMRAANALKEKKRLAGKENVLGAEVLAAGTAVTPDEAFSADVDTLRSDLDDFATAQVDTRSSPRQFKDVTVGEFNLTPDRFDDPSDQAVFLAASGRINQLDAAELAGAKGMRLQMARMSAFRELLNKHGNDPEAQNIIAEQFIKYGSLFEAGDAVAKAEQEAAQKTIDEIYAVALPAITELGMLPANPTKAAVNAVWSQVQGTFNSYQQDTAVLKKLQNTSGISKVQGEIAGRNWLRNQGATFLAGAMSQAQQIVKDSAESDDPSLLVSALKQQQTLVLDELRQLTQDVDPREVEAISRTLQQVHKNAIALGTKDDMLKFYQTSVQSQASFAMNKLYQNPGFAENVEVMRILKNVQLTTLMSRQALDDMGRLQGNIVQILNPKSSGFDRMTGDETPNQRAVSATAIKIQAKSAMDQKMGKPLLDTLTNMVLGAPTGTDKDIDSVLLDTMAYDGYIDTMKTLGTVTPDSQRTLAIIGDRFDTIAREESRALRAEFDDNTVDKVFIPHQGSIGVEGTIEREDIVYDVTLNRGMPTWSVSAGASSSAVRESKLSLERLNGKFGNTLGKLVRAIAHAALCSTDKCYQTAYDSVMLSFADAK